MPCRSDYMEQSNSERRFQQTARLLVMLRNHLSLPTADKFYKQAKNSYAQNVGQVEALCETIRENREQFEVYLTANLRSSAEARELADWWDEHEAEDRKREALEAKRQADFNRLSEIMQSLSNDDLRILKERLR